MIPRHYLLGNHTSDFGATICSGSAARVFDVHCAIEGRVVWGAQRGFPGTIDHPVIPSSLLHAASVEDI